MKVAFWDSLAYFLFQDRFYLSDFPNIFDITSFKFQTWVGLVK